MGFSKATKGAEVDLADFQGGWAERKKAARREVRELLKKHSNRVDDTISRQMRAICEKYNVLYPEDVL
jgi:hypothetical protein